MKSKPVAKQKETQKEEKLLKEADKKIETGLKVFESEAFSKLTTRASIEEPLKLQVFDQETIQEMAEFMANEILPAMNAFGKRQSQYMNLMMTLNMETPARNARQCISEIERRREALREAETRLKRLLLKFKQLRKEYERLKEEPLKEGEDEEERNLKIWKLQVMLEDTYKKIVDQRLYIEGAMKHIHCFSEAYKEIVKNAGMENWDEEDFERAEHEFHVKRAFTQAMRDFRNHGCVGVGNQEYFEDCGINPTDAIADIQRYFKEVEEPLLRQGKTIGIEKFYEFLDQMYEKYKDSWKYACKRKGISSTFFEGSLWKRKKKREANHENT